jgi:hypothetical protein
MWPFKKKTRDITNPDDVDAIRAETQKIDKTILGMITSSFQILSIPGTKNDVSVEANRFLDKYLLTKGQDKLPESYKAVHVDVEFAGYLGAICDHTYYEKNKPAVMGVSLEMLQKIEAKFLDDRSKILTETDDQWIADEIARKKNDDKQQARKPELPY